MPISKLHRAGGIFVSFAAASCVVAVAAIVAGTPALAADDEALDTKIFRNILEGVGLRAPSGPEINYRERSPLVIPPSLSLPPPEKDSAAANPNWPVDPEIKRAKAQKAAERSQPRSNETFDQEARPLPPDQLNKGPRTTSAADAGGPDERESARPMSPSALGYKGGMFSGLFGKGKDNEVAKYTGEPPRVSLTDPPVGYQTPAPDQPYGLGKDNDKPKPFDYLNDRATQK
jgi:hypothetical protein